MTILHWPARRTHTGALTPRVPLPSPIPMATTGPQRPGLPGSGSALPRDPENRQRLEYQHHVLHLALGNHYLTPLPPSLRTILDVGAGTGLWCREMARQFPQSLVLGLDLDPTLFHPTVPDGCLLRRGDVLNGLPLPDQFADFTHQRLLGQAIPDASWPAVVHELVRVTQRGGWLELLESDGRVLDAGPATARVMTWLETLRATGNRRGEAIRHLGDLLEHEGLEQIETLTLRLPLGAWGGRAGQMMARSVLAGIQGLREPCEALGVQAETFGQGVQAMAAEWQQGRACCTLWAAYGRRVAL